MATEAKKIERIATPLPWNIGGTFNPGTDNEFVNIWGPTPAGMQSGDTVAKTVRPADAERIIAAVNAFDDLVAALNLAADELTHATWAKGADQRGLKYAIEKARAAIAKATATP